MSPPTARGRSLRLCANCGTCARPHTRAREITMGGGPPPPLQPQQGEQQQQQQQDCQQAQARVGHGPQGGSGERGAASSPVQGQAGLSGADFLSGSNAPYTSPLSFPLGTQANAWAGPAGSGSARSGNSGSHCRHAARREALGASKSGPRKALGPSGAKIRASLRIMTWNVANLTHHGRDLALVNLLVLNRADIMFVTKQSCQRRWPLCLPSLGTLRSSHQHQPAEKSAEW
jgi:hypothetical protein